MKMKERERYKEVMEELFLAYQGLTNDTLAKMIEERAVENISITKTDISRIRNNNLKNYPSEEKTTIIFKELELLAACSRQGFLQELKATCHPIEQIPPHYNKLYWVYTFKKNKKTDKNQLARALLKVDKNGEVYLKNIDHTHINFSDGHIEEYFGECGIDDENDELVFKLKGKPRQIQHERKLTITLMLESPKREIKNIAIGCYITYDSVPRMIMGTIVFDRIFDKKMKDCVNRIGAFNYGDSNISSINKSILNFLAYKKNNLIKLRKGIHSNAALNKWINNLHSSSQLESCDVFISTPTRNLDKKGFHDMKQYAEQIKEITGRKLRSKNISCVILTRNYLTAPYNDLHWAVEEKILNAIRSCEFFLLIYPEFARAETNSLIELGIAIQAKKKIICFRDIKDEKPLPALLDHHSYLQKIQKVDYNNLKALEKVPDLFVFDPQEISIS